MCGPSDTPWPRRPRGSQDGSSQSCGASNCPPVGPWCLTRRETQAMRARSFRSWMPNFRTVHGITAQSRTGGSNARRPLTYCHSCCPFCPKRVLIRSRYLRNIASLPRSLVYANTRMLSLHISMTELRPLKHAGARFASNAVDSGIVSTNFARNNGILAWAKHTISHALRGELTSAVSAAETLVYLATSNEVAGLTGALFRERQMIEPSTAAKNPLLAAALWSESVVTSASLRFPDKRNEGFLGAPL
jgi:hypothetical protein